MSENDRGSRVSRVGDTVSSGGTTGTAPVCRPGATDRGVAARPGRYRAERGLRRRLRSVPPGRTLPDAAGTLPFVGVGSVLGERYRLERVLGDGGTATVFGGTDTVLGRTVAVKVFHAKSDVTVQARREREIHLASGFVHPHLVAVYDAHLGAGTDQPTYLVCEYVDGPSLAQRLDGGPLPADEVAAIGIGIAHALAVLSTAGVVHRDVKPGNILLDHDTGRAKLGDFGIARDLGTDPVTRTDDVIGTAPYLSPEQARGEPIGCPSDVYSLGLVLLECLTGHREYDGEPIPAAVARLIRDPVVPAELPTPWPTLLRRMTSRNPDQRPAADEVAAILATRVRPAIAKGQLTNTGHHPAPGGPTHRVAPAARRHGWLLTAAVAVLLTAGVVSGITGPEPAADPPATSPPESAASSLPTGSGPVSATPTVAAPPTGPGPSTLAPSTAAEPVANNDIPEITAAEPPPPAVAAGDDSNPPDPPNPAGDEGPPNANPGHNGNHHGNGHGNGNGNGQINGQGNG